MLLCRSTSRCEDLFRYFTLVLQLRPQDFQGECELWTPQGVFLLEDQVFVNVEAD